MLRRVLALVLLCACLSVALAQATPRHIKILWLGNSFTQHMSNGHPLYLHYWVREMINQGDTSNVVVDSSVAIILYSQGLGMHLFNQPSLDAIRIGRYDYVVLQGFINTLDSANMVMAASSEIEAGAILADSVRAAGGIPVVYCHHPRCEGYTTQPDRWPFVINAFETMADSTRSVFAPASVSWLHARATLTDLVTHDPDCLHQGVNGHYLNACVFYSVFTGLSPVGNPVKSYFGTSYTDDTLAFLQQAAWETYDSVLQAHPIAVDRPAPNSARPAYQVRSQGSGLVFLWQRSPADVRLYGLDGRQLRPVAGVSLAKTPAVRQSGGLPRGLQDRD